MRALVYDCSAGISGDMNLAALIDLGADRENLERELSKLHVHGEWKLECRRAQQDGKRVAVPKVFGDEMKFLWLDDLNAVAPGAYNIPEPIADGPEADDETALVLMPGLAFDPEGHRLGYGGGFYDKFLAAEPDHPTLALCYDFQMLPHLDTESYDIPVDRVLLA